ncbi:MAG TPA: FliM/FliN family flagellar motor switch protein [Terriglobales bacterium]|jgi:flagellar motor switch protein FliM
MDKVLNQEQIDNLVRAARGSSAGVSNVVRWDARLAGQIGRDQMQSITLLHEGFARKLTHVLGAYLRIGFEAKLVSAEYLPYGEFLQGIPEVTYMASCKLAPIGATALLYVDLAVAYPLLDVLLGGEGKGELPTREMTEVEEQILETCLRLVLHELESAWQALAIEFQFESRQRPQEVQRLMPLEEKTLSLSFEIIVNESRGTLNLAVPALASSALLHKITSTWVRPKPRLHVDFNQRLRARLMESPFRVELGTGTTPVSTRQLLELKPGNLLMLTKRVDEPASLVIAGKELFHAMVGRRGAWRVSQVLRRIEQSQSERRPRL